MTNCLSKLCFFSCLLLMAKVVSSIEIDNFPKNCSEASVKHPLDGHIIRLGVVKMADDGLVFSFPDEASDTLQEVGIADNVGLIGQNPDRDYRDVLRLLSPSASFVVAQIFIADDRLGPVVTCLSRLRPLSGYVWSDYDTNLPGLNLAKFRERLARKQHSRWHRPKWHHHNKSKHEAKKSGSTHLKPRGIIDLASRKAAFMKKKLEEARKFPKI